ncbi:MAG: hypothetical protein WCF08_03880, partial [Anaerolineaceae bacterium]
SLTPPPPSLTFTPTESLTFTPSPSDTPAGTSTDTQTATRTPPPSKTPSNTPLPTKTIIRAEVLERANCRYGPGSMYLYKYGLVPGSNMNVIGRIESNAWVYIQAIGGSNPCWVNASLVKITGDLAGVEIVYPGKALLPVSPYYPPVSWVNAARNDATISVSWNDIPLRVGDEEDEFMQHYIVEVWRCEGGQLLFDPIGTNELYVSFIDQYGCGLPSHGRVYVQEKHGFAGPVEIPWP